MASHLEVLNGSCKTKMAEEWQRKEDKHQEIIVLNVGGKRFSTSRQTLTWIPDSFFTSLLSGRIPSLRDETGAIFIDRDSDSFGPILNFMRTRNVDLRNIDIKTLKHEAEFFGLLPLVKRLSVCDELDRSNCGSLLFYCQISPPVFESLPPNFGICSQQSSKTDLSRQIVQLTGHGNCIAVAYNHCICVLGVRESRGWEVIFSTPLLDKAPQRVSLNTRSAGGVAGEPILAAVVGFEIRVWTCSPTTTKILASFDMKLQVDGLFFIGKQLVGISNTGKVVVWQSVQRHWQLQEVEAICSYDMAGSFLLLGCTNGSIYYIDMEKFPVRMKDNDLLVTQLFEDPCKDPITALSVYVTPNVFSGQNWMEVAYGTQAGTVRVVVRHPENIGQAPQIFQSYNVHTCPIMRVVLGERHLISVCAENHVRTWTVTRFRGRISTQPGSTPIASFKVLSLEGAHSLFYPVNSIGPFGERDEEQVFIQRVIPETNIIFVRSSSTGNRVCKIESVDGSNISAYYVHECDAVNRSGLRCRRFIFTGHVNGTVQVWDLTSALELAHKSPDASDGGPSKPELLALLQNCDISPASRVSSTFSSRAPSPSPSLMSIMYPSIKLPGGRGVPASPLSTPVLNVGRASKMHATAAGGDNLFQPICMSHSNSSTSFGDGAVSKESEKVLVAPGSPGSMDKEPVLVTQVPTADVSPGVNAAVLRFKTGKKEDEEEVGNGGDRMSDSNVISNRCKFDIDGNAHQRSRSNEMDYGSLRSDGRRRPRLHSFRSPSGSVQAIKPLGTTCPDSPTSTPAQTDSSMGSPVGRSDSPPNSDDAISSVKGRDSQSEPRESFGEREKPNGLPGDQFSLLKEFDASVWSNYFSSLDNPCYSDS